MISLPPYRVLPLIEDHRDWSMTTYGPTTDRVLASTMIGRRILQALRAIEECPDIVAAHTNVFILAMDLAWRADGSGPAATSVELTEALAARRIRPSVASAIRELAGPYIPRGADIMAWAASASAERGVSGDGFLTEVWRRLDIAKRCRDGLPTRIAA